MKKIHLTQGKYALVDDKNYESLNELSWFYDGGYAARKAPVKIYMHRVVNNTPEGMETDHINRNRLDNRRANLRSVTSSQNSLNITTRKDNKSGCTGVFWNRGKNKWQAYISLGKKRKHLGYFNSIKDAIKARKGAETWIQPSIYRESTI